MEPLLRGSKSWKCSDTLILLVITCSCILAISSSTSTNSGGRREDWGERPEKLGANKYMYGGRRGGGGGGGGVESNIVMHVHVCLVLP